MLTFSDKQDHGPGLMLFNIYMYSQDKEQDRDKQVTPT